MTRRDKASRRRSRCWICGSSRAQVFLGVPLYSTVSALLFLTRSFLWHIWRLGSARLRECASERHAEFIEVHRTEVDTTRLFKEASKQDDETPSSYTPREIVKSSHTAVCRVLNPAESDNKGAFTGMVHDAYMSNRVNKQDHSK
jgi:hypothetical protein